MKRFFILLAMLVFLLEAPYTGIAEKTAALPVDNLLSVFPEISRQQLQDALPLGYKTIGKDTARLLIALRVDLSDFSRNRPDKDIVTLYPECTGFDEFQWHDRKEEFKQRWQRDIKRYRSTILYIRASHFLNWTPFVNKKVGDYDFEKKRFRLGLVALGDSLYTKCPDLSRSFGISFEQSHLEWGIFARMADGKVAPSPIVRTDSRYGFWINGSLHVSPEEAKTVKQQLQGGWDIIILFSPRKGKIRPTRFYAYNENLGQIVFAVNRNFTTRVHLSANKWVYTGVVQRRDMVIEAITEGISSDVRFWTRLGRGKEKEAKRYPANQTMCKQEALHIAFRRSEYVPTHTPLMLRASKDCDVVIRVFD